MLHIVFIVGNYFPYYSAVGKCVGNVADELSKKHKVTVICQKNYSAQEEVEIYNKQKIIRVNYKENKIRGKLNKNIESSNGYKNALYKGMLNAYKLSRVIKIFFSNTTINKDLVNAYTKALYNFEESIDVIVPSSMPFECVVAASKFVANKKQNSLMIPYLFDHFVNNESLHRSNLNMRVKKSNHLKMEKNVLDNAKAILIMNQLSQYFKSEYDDYENKFFIVEHPLVKEYAYRYNNSKILKVNPNQLKIVYTGSFYKKLRNPEYFLKVVEKALTNLDAKIDLFIFGNCNDIVNKYTSQNKSIINHGKVSTDKAYEAIDEANILIAVGNSDNSQVPSKIFEYMSFGKPIIYFYSNDDDVNLKILKKYTLFLGIKQDSEKYENNAKLFSEFCLNNSNALIPIKEIENIYKEATPQFTADLIVQILDHINTNLL